MNLDLNTLFQLIQTVILVIGSYYFYVNLISELDKKLAVLTSQREQELKSNNEKFDAIEKQLERLNQTTNQIALQEHRLNAVDDRMKELSIKLEALRDIKALPPPRRTNRKS